MHNDPLKQLSFNTSSRSKFLGEEADINYRAGLEISRTGELALRIPQDLPIHIERPRPVPKEASREVMSQYNKLIKIYESLGPNENKSKGDLDDVQLLLDQDDTKDYGKLIQVKIFYSLGHKPCGLSSGYVFRQPYSDRSETEEKMTATTAYTVGGGGSLRDLDGVRCWVPCVDSPDQRAIYDITIHAPSSMQVSACRDYALCF
jgi:hypothetical protein